MTREFNNEQIEEPLVTISRSHLEKAWREWGPLLHKDYTIDQLWRHLKESVQPKPYEAWIWVSNNQMAYRSKAELEEFFVDRTEGRAIRVREVTDES